MKGKKILLTLLTGTFGLLPQVSMAQALHGDDHTDCCEFHRQQTLQTRSAARRIITASNSADINPTDGKYVQILNVGTEAFLTEGIMTGAITHGSLRNNDYSQVWKMVASGTKWKLQNALTGKFINSGGGSVSQTYYTSAAGSTFNIAAIDSTAVNDYTIFDTGSAYLHAQSAGSTLVGWWDATIPASRWIFREVSVNTTELAQAQAAIKEAQIYTNAANKSNLFNTLKNYFTDNQYTELKPEFVAMSDADLRTKLTQTPAQNSLNRITLPSGIVNFVMKVKQNSWAAYEKEFRIYDYKPYSDHTQWNSFAYAGTGYTLSPQTGPTGISVKKGDAVLIFVGSNNPSGTTLKAMLCAGMNVTGPEVVLTRGYNAVIADEDSHLFINYVITDTQKKIASVPPITIHIEGGYVNGCFDITRGHTNSDWHNMIAAGLFTDTYTHLKNKYYQFNVHTNRVKSYTLEYEKNLVASDGVPKSLVGLLTRWDQLVEQQRTVMGLNTDSVKERFNCYLSASASSTGNPYASTYGTYYPGVGSWMNYMDMTRGYSGDEGGDFWMVAHETGHIHQSAINIAGDTEVSVNFFSQVNRWLQGSNVGRGRPLQNTIDSYLSNAFYSEYNLWQRSRMYFQLYLYYHVQKHDTLFYPKLFALLRKDPMEKPTNAAYPGSGLVNYLKFAIKASQAAGEDLSEFFRLYGFFKPITNYTVGDYTNTYFTTTQADIDKAIAEMNKYPKAHPGLFFIDERIRTSPASNPEYSGNRMATSDDASPGVTSEVGQMGMVFDFDKDLVVRNYTASYTASTGRLAFSGGKGAVGVKIYDEDGNLVYVTNNFSTYLPATLRSKKFVAIIAFGNGTQQVAYNPHNLDADVITSIDAVRDDTSDAQQSEVKFDLSGRRTDSKQHGVYIVNGRTVVR